MSRVSGKLSNISKVPIYEFLLFLSLLLSSLLKSPDSVYADTNKAETFVPDILHILDQQDEIFERSKDRVATGVSGVPELFVLAVASDADAGVFENEVRGALSALKTHFSLGKRYLLLINSYSEESLTQWPLLTKESLRKGLQLMGRRMNSEDVLLLLLSGHGDPDRGLIVSFAEQKRASIKPADVHHYLQDASIPHSLTIVTGCYSGVFVPKKPFISHGFFTATARDRQSFGCLHKRAFTYFGESLFVHALPNAGTIEELLDSTQRYNATLEEEKQVLSANPIVQLSPELRRVFNTVFLQSRKHTQ